MENLERENSEKGFSLFYVLHIQFAGKYQRKGQKCCRFVLVRKKMQFMAQYQGLKGEPEDCFALDA